MSLRLNPILYITVLFLTGFVSLAEAHNGQVVLAYPVEGITVDGDLSDWPDDVVRYSIHMAEHGSIPGDAEDFRGGFRVGFNAEENALYIGLEVEDESTVIDTTLGRYNAQDGCEIYVSIDHVQQPVPVHQYVIYGDRESRYGKVRRQDRVYQYEWCLPVDGIGEVPARLQPGMVLGFDIAVCDKDEDGSFSWMTWGRGVDKFRDSSRLGDLLLVDGSMEMGELAGRAAWQNSADPVSRGKMRISSTASEDFWVQIETDRQGLFSLDLPADTYVLTPVSPGRAARKKISLRIEENSKTEVGLEIVPSSGLPVEAGRGKSQPASLA